jgi:23S rRNA (cytosine1962-C5)-methyltransferase
MPRPSLIASSTPIPAPLPDRSLDPEAELPTVVIRSAGLHPFIYQKMVVGPTGGIAAVPGDLVRIVDREGVQIGYGLWNPRSRISLRVVSREPDPPGFDFWSRKIGDAVALRTRFLGLDRETNAYRVIHAEGDGLSGLIVDRFDDVLSVEVFSLGIYQRIGPILKICGDLLGTKHARVRVDDWIAKLEGFPGRPAETPNLPPRVTIEEHGIRYRIRFDQGHKTGFFCDQRENRRRLAEFCRDQSVLDLCCYTGGFGLNALIRGKARDVTCVDLDEKVVAQARENGNANQVRLDVVHADAFGYMRQMVQNGKRFGVVVLDPAKLIADRDEVSLGKRKYYDMNSLALKIVEPGGLLVTCSCSGLLAPEEFLGILRAASRNVGRNAQLLAMTSASEDHPVSLDAPEGSYLKVAWLRVGETIASPPENGEPSE